MAVKSKKRSKLDGPTSGGATVLVIDSQQTETEPKECDEADEGSHTLTSEWQQSQEVDAFVNLVFTNALQPAQ